MIDLDNLLKIKVFDNTTGKSYVLLGFTSKGDDRVGFKVSSMRLLDVDARYIFIVNEGPEMKKYALYN
jgi:hypothetical protein